MRSVLVGLGGNGEALQGEIVKGFRPYSSRETTEDAGEGHLFGARFFHDAPGDRLFAYNPVAGLETGDRVPGGAQVFDRYRRHFSETRERVVENVFAVVDRENRTVESGGGTEK